MKIVKIDDEGIVFDNGDIISCYHSQECCENNWADFRQLKDTGVENEKFNLPLKFEVCEGGFRFGNEGKMYFVPCYSDQNGYYSYKVEVWYLDRSTRNHTTVLKEVYCDDKSYNEWDDNSRPKFIKIN